MHFGQCYLLTVDTKMGTERKRKKKKKKEEEGRGAVLHGKRTLEEKAICAGRVHTRTHTNKSTTTKTIIKKGGAHENLFFPKRKKKTGLGKHTINRQGDAKKENSTYMQSERASERVKQVSTQHSTAQHIGTGSTSILFFPLPFSFRTHDHQIVKRGRKKWSYRAGGSFSRVSEHHETLFPPFLSFFLLCGFF